MIRIALSCLLVLVAIGCTPQSNAPWFVSDVSRNVGGGATFDVVRDLGAGWQGDVWDRHYVYLTADGKPGTMTAEVNSCPPSDTSCSDDVGEEGANGLVLGNHWILPDGLLHSSETAPRTIERRDSTGHVLWTRRYDELAAGVVTLPLGERLLDNRLFFVAKQNQHNVAVDVDIDKGTALATVPLD